MKERFYDKEEEPERITVRTGLGDDIASKVCSKADDLGRPLTDDEVRAEAMWQLEDLPYKGLYEGEELAKAKMEMKALIEG